MPSQLSTIAPAKRRQLAATLGLFAVLFLAVGAVGATGARTPVLTAFVVIAFVIALVLALLGWGVLSSVRADGDERAERSLDSAIAEAMAAHGVSGCGHDHDPSELHLVGDEHVASVDNPCEQDGHGTGCTHTCQTCVLTTLGPRPRPSPVPRT